MKQGIDLSHHNKVTDWGKIKKDFIIHKCTEGTTYLDPTYKARKKYITGSYHFAGGGDAIKEADWYLNNCGNEELFLDWEIHHEDPVGWCKKFIGHLKEKGRDCGLYTNDARAVAYSWPKDWKFWIARYGQNLGSLDPNYAPRFKNWTIWQYSSRGSQLGVVGNVDLNVMKEENNMELKPMAKLHLFGHMDRNFVKVGDNVIKYVTPIGTLGNGNGQYYAHLHFSISRGLTPAQLKSYIAGWSKAKVEQYYENPVKINFEKMFGRKMDVGNFGYGWLDWVGYGFHPGVDVNGLGGGNTDFGYPFKASCDGKVILEERTWFKNRGWGNLIIIEEK